MKKAYFENLDTLRFFAFFAVFLTHTIHHTQLEEFFAKNIVLREIVLFVSDGGEGVSFFFVLSGFLITYLILIEKQQTGFLNLKNFYIRRILRIFPLYYAVILFGFLVYPLMKSVIGMDTFQPHDWKYHMVFLSNIDLISIYHNPDIKSDILMLVINWSLSVEEQFYIVFPLLLVLVPRKYYLSLFTVIIFLSLIFRFFHVEDNISLKFHTFAVMGDLALGATIAYLVIYRNLDNFFSSLSKAIIVVVYIIGFIWVIFDNVFFPFKEYLIIGRLIHTIFYAFIILEQNYSNYSLFKLGKLKMVSFWGKYTYGLYLLHPIGMQIWIILLEKKLGWNLKDFGWHQLTFIILSFTSTLILGYLSYHIFEKSFLKFKDSFVVVR